MKHLTLLLIVICFSSNLLSQKTEIEINELRNDHLLSLTDSSQKMLTPEEIKEFQGLDYFKFDSKFQIEARFKKEERKEV